MIQSRRLGLLPPYLFCEIDRKKAAYAKSGRRVLDLGLGDPDTGAPEELRRRLFTSLEDKGFDRYPSDRGLPRLRDAIKNWAERRYGVMPGDDELLVTIGSKEAIAHLPLATVNEGETVLVPDPGYPVYYSSVVFAGARPRRIPLDPEDGFWPDLDSLADSELRKARLLFLNYPNNPTSATAGAERFERAARLCGERRILLVNDAAYSEICFDGKRGPALFPIARKSGVEHIEFFSFSKTFSITGWRIGFAVGSPGVVSALARLKSNIDSGVFGAIQDALAGVLEGNPEEITARIMSIYSERRDILDAGLRKAGFVFMKPAATFYFWVRVPGDGKSIDFCGSLLERTGIVATPGVGFGEKGEGFFRLSLTAPTDTIREAAERLGDFQTGAV